MAENRNVEQLREIYYDPSQPGSFSGAASLAAAAGITKKVAQNWLNNQLTYSLHKSARKKYVTRPYRVAKIDAQWQCDLVEMRENDGFKYLLTCIDLFSRFAWSRPLKSKSSKDVLRAFKSIIDDSGRRYAKLQSDKGLEILNRL